MSLPDEELRSLKQANEFITEMITCFHSKKWLLRLLVSKKARLAMSRYAYYARKHYPFDHVLDAMWAERIEKSEKEIRGE